MQCFGLQTIREDLPLIVLDLGYSRNQASCGIISPSADEPKEMKFGDAIEATSSLIVEYGPCVLVLEAVLSTFHLPNGNPDIRGDFEKGRGWYHGAGVATFAAAIRFISRLSQTTEDPINIFLGEAFLSFKKKRTRHLEDAARIAREFWDTSPEDLKRGTEPASNLIKGVPSVRAFLPEES